MPHNICSLGKILDNCCNTMKTKAKSMGDLPINPSNDTPAYEGAPTYEMVEIEDEALLQISQSRT